MHFLCDSRKKEERNAVYKLDSTEVGELVGILSHRVLLHLWIEVSPEDFLLLLQGLEKNKTLRTLRLNLIPPTDAAIKGLADFITFNRTINDFAFNFEFDNFCTIAQHQQLWDALRHNAKISNLWLDHSSYDDKCFTLTVRNTKIEHIVTRFMEEYGVTQEISDLYVKNYSNLFLGCVDFQWSAQIIEEELKEGEISLSEIDSDVNCALLNISRNDADAFQLYVLQAQWLEIKIDLIFQYGTEEEISEFISQCLNLTPKV
ncbi:MAG: hypothetical protein J0I93_08885, partial [Legionella sp.]|nr:hypothetical protein [Legionella sp.]